MQGRKTGTIGGERAAAYIVAELTRMSVSPAGSDGTYFEGVPITLRQLDLTTAALQLTNPRVVTQRAGTAPGEHERTAPPGVAFVPLTGAFGLGTPWSSKVPLRDSLAEFVYGGRLGDPGAIKPAFAARRIVAFLAPLRADGLPDYQLWSMRDQLIAYGDAAAILVGSLELMPKGFMARVTGPQYVLLDRVATAPRVPPIVAVTHTAIEEGIPDDGKSGRHFTPARTRENILAVKDHGALSYVSRDIPLDAPARNVVAAIEGSDPDLKSEFVVLSAHMDHLGLVSRAEREGGDSVYHGADDSGTGSIALLEIAQYIASLPVKPKRTILFLWTVGEEQGLLGSEYFADHPTRPRGQIVANITVDMIGRGGANEIAGGGPAYLQAIGSRRLSTEFADWISAIAAQSGPDFRLEEQPASDQLCDGDDWHFARWGIPSVRISTGQSADFHQLTDVVAKIDFAKYTRVTRLVAAMAQDIANRPARPRTDKPKPDPHRECVF
jgi:Zn-dependent M28 family amino/carboxypeptidase